MKANIWGANGYIGQHLVWYLKNKGWEIKCFDIQNSFLTNNDVEYYQVDITSKNAIQNVDHNCDFLFFFAGLTGTNQSFDIYESYVKVNEIGFLHLLDSIKNFERKPHIIFPSSRLVYKGKKNIALKETSKKEFKTIYASSKYNGEMYLEMYSRLHNINYTIFRICVPFGNVFSKEFSYGTIGFFLSKASQNLPIVLFGDGNLKRTFTHVIDICDQIVRILVFEKSKNECFNIKGETFSLLEIANQISINYGVAVEKIKWPELALKLESGDTIFDSSKIESIMPVKLKYQFSEWLTLNLQS